MTTTLPRRETFEWVTYSYRRCTEEAKKDFAGWLVSQDWMDVVLAEGSDAKAKAYQDLIDAAVDTFFLVCTVRRKSTDLPWMNRAILRKIGRRKRLYRKEGRSEAWKFLKKKEDR